MFNRLNFVQLR